MIPELGQLLLNLALAVALVQGVLPLWGAQRGRADCMALARPTALLQALLVAGAFACLTASFVRCDFSVRYVAAHANLALPLAYRVAAVWGGHEGSLLLWVLMLCGWSVAVAQFSHRLPPTLVARILAVLGLVGLGFLLFMLVASNPFERLWPAPADGQDLNPLLQDPGMVAHPPMLYMGYVGFAVAFAFAIAALIGGQLDATWARWTRPWTTAAWLCLTCGIGLGSWWAYNELGWGGWWFWDPVENASFMPWLAGTALIHSLAVTEKRGSFKAWTVLLAILAFSLSLVGTFLVRSGVLSSVHAFATDPRRGLFILVLLLLVIGGSLLLYAWRAPQLGLGQRFGMVSRESVLLLNNMLLASACGAVLLGTLYPLAIDALGLGKLSVGPPYFDAVFGLLMAPVLALMGVGPLVHWKQHQPGSLPGALRGLAGASVAGGLTLAWLQGRPRLEPAGAAVGAAGGWADGVASLCPASAGGLALALWVAATVLLDLWQRLRPRADGQGVLNRLRLLPRSVLGMLVAHLGVALFAFGVAMVKTGETASDATMGPNSQVELAGYRFTLRTFSPVQGPNYRALQAQVDVHQGDTLVATLWPEKRRYAGDGNPMTEAAVHSTALRDLYISLGEPLPGGAWTVRLQHKPFIGWIWGGCLVMVLGGGLAASDRRYRAKASASAPQTTAWTRPQADPIAPTQATTPARQGVAR